MLFLLQVCIPLLLLSGAPPSLSGEAQETSFFLFNMLSIQLELWLCAVLSGEQSEETVLLLMFLPEVISSPKPCWWEKA